MEKSIANTIVRLQSTESTNNYANQQIRSNDVPEGTVFLAYEQTSGRGQSGNFGKANPVRILPFRWYFILIFWISEVSLFFPK
jgi:BirA family biotin operon repressor/biotin-[acetyl-CoA-carboxylase] ligase